MNVREVLPVAGALEEAERAFRRCDAVCCALRETENKHEPGGQERMTLLIDESQQ